MEKTEIVIAEEAVRNQLASILKRSEIKNSQILVQFLEFVVMETIAGHRDEIKEYTIGVKALGRPSDFNPQLDAVVRIHAGRLRRILVQYYQGDGKDDPVVISIPKGTYIPVFELRDNDAELTKEIKIPAREPEQKKFSHTQTRFSRHSFQKSEFRKFKGLLCCRNRRTTEYQPGALRKCFHHLLFPFRKFCFH